MRRGGEDGVRACCGMLLVEFAFVRDEDENVRDRCCWGSIPGCVDEKNRGGGDPRGCCCCCGGGFVDCGNGIVCLACWDGGDRRAAALPAV